MVQQEINRTNHDSNEDVWNAAISRLQGFIDGPDSIDKAFTHSEVASGVQMLVDPGDDPAKIPMRANFSSDAELKYAAAIISKARRALGQGSDVEKEVLFVIAGKCGIHGKRAELLVDAIVGERRQRQAQSFGDKLKGVLRI